MMMRLIAEEMVRAKDRELDLFYDEWFFPPPEPPRWWQFWQQSAYHKAQAEYRRAQGARLK